VVKLSTTMKRYLVLLAAVVSTCLLLLLPTSTHSLAANAAGSKKKTRARGGGGGFGSSSSASTTASGFTPDTSDSTMRLVDFLKAQKADIANVAIGFKAGDENGRRQQRGLFATKTFGRAGGGQILCKIPSDCALALSDPAQKGQDAPTMAHGGANLWNMYLKNGAEKRTIFAPYLDTLPTRDDITPTPDFLSAEELQLLEFPRIIHKAQERRQNIEKISQETGIPLENLQYATWLVSSRAYPLSVSADDETMAEFDDRGQVLSKVANKRNFIRVLVPLLDMVNHASVQSQSSNSANARWTMIDPQKDAAWFALESTRPIAAGQEITIAYGSGVDSSVELYQNYGIVLPPSQPRHFIDTLMLKKGGDDCLNSIDEWTTTLLEDEVMLEMLSKEEETDISTVNLKKILAFRIKLKQAYPPASDKKEEAQ
jgi:SET domain